MVIAGVGLHSLPSMERSPEKSPEKEEEEESDFGVKGLMCVWI